ncbi:MAG: hypothetical protein BAJALOKI3v1_450014 [Promethearchaeota archaeon]|nr:MAG: hypothetical protein BAJALOKI3v1_450014 [Candidatus Lokiarchaeota archaeon]
MDVRFFTKSFSAFFRVEIDGVEYEFGFESDGRQHANIDEGFESWLGLSKEINKLEKITDKAKRDELRERLEERWQKYVIEKDDFKDDLFNHKDHKDKFLIRVPTWSDEASWERRVEFIINYLKTKCGFDLGVHASMFDGIDEDIWETMFDDLKDPKDSEKP